MHKNVGDKIVIEGFGDFILVTLELISVGEFIFSQLCEEICSSLFGQFVHLYIYTIVNL